MKGWQHNQQIQKLRKLEEAGFDLITRLGLEVRKATNGQEAIALWQQWQPDLTRMDIRNSRIGWFQDGIPNGC